MVRVLASSAELDEAIRRGGTGGVIVIDFYADWCGPCRVIAPFFEELAARFTSVVFFKVNVDHSRDLATRYGIRAMPTFIVLKAGQEVERIMGGDRAKLEQSVSQHAAAANPNAASLDERAFLEQFARASDRYAKYYDDMVYRTLARSVIPVEVIEEAEKKGATLEVAVKLLSWFKQSFFTWTDVPACPNCHSTPSREKGLTGTATKEELEDGAGRVEVYECSCGREIRFPRYENPVKLLETRTGRCGEWANCFTLCAAALGFETRYVLDTTDHVWTELRLDGRWIHFDACEEVYDKPLLYEKGWGKKLSYVVALAADHATDVTWRYVMDSKETMKRRTRVRESLLSSFILKLSSRLLRAKLEREGKAAEIEKRKNELNMQRCRELIELINLGGGRKDENEYGGRKSGDDKWKKERGEDGGGGEASQPTTPFSFQPSEEDAEGGVYSIEYDVVKDVYRDGMEEKRGWKSGVFTAERIQRKVETDWKMAYLCREEGSSEAVLIWHIDLSKGPLPHKVTIHVTGFHNTEGGQVTATACLGDDFCLLLRDGKTVELSPQDLETSRSVSVKALFSGGNGPNAFQHSQIFRSPLDSAEPVFKVNVYYK